MLIAGLHSGHDSSFCILENGKPIFHAELERYIREKQPKGDSIKFLFEEFDRFNEISYFTHTADVDMGGIEQRHPETFNQLLKIADKNGGTYHEIGHHVAHAASAFFSSNFEESLVVTIDGGGPEFFPDGDPLPKRDVFPCTLGIFRGTGNKIYPIARARDEWLNIGAMWNQCTKKIFGLSGGWPKGDQAGSVMAMASMGNPETYYEYLNQFDLNPLVFRHHSEEELNHPETTEVFRAQYKKQAHYREMWQFLIEEAKKSEKAQFDIAAALQKCTEEKMEHVISKYTADVLTNNLCLAGGVALNSVMVGKMFDWYGGKFKNIYVCPVPYDAGLSIGAAQFVWHHILDNPREIGKNNATPYLGVEYSEEDVKSALTKHGNIVVRENKKTRDMLELLADGKIISIFSGKSESGRRALGNRSILADPRNPNMKDLINEKVKHRQWYRPFAPSILREEVGNWFEKDVESPYMSVVLKFKKEMGVKVPAVNHFDGTARLQTVTKEDNLNYYNLLKEWQEISGVPIVLNTSFNDREPIVETPEHAINCFLKTDIDFLYFADYDLLVGKE